MRISLVIPAYNEGKTIGSVVRTLSTKFKEIEDSFEIIVVDNGSRDDTSGVLENLKRDIPQLVTTRVFPNQGYGNGILAGLAIAKGEVVGWTHADGQVQADDIVKVYQKLRNENLDFCKVNRIVRDEHPIRIVQSKLYNSLFRLMFRTSYGDINGCPKLFRRSLWEKADLNSKDWFIDPEIVIKAVRSGAAMGEIPVRWQARAGGSSKVKVGTWFEFLKNMIAYRFFNKQ